MPPKAKGGKKEAKKAGGAGADGELHQQLLLSNYTRFAKLIGLVPNPRVVTQLQDDAVVPLTQLIVNDEFGPLGPGGVRALVTAILASGQDMKGEPYQWLKTLRMWRSRCGDEGSRCLAEMLRCPAVKLEYLELFDCGVSARGAMTLGQALSVGCNKSLLTLKLDYNMNLGTEGVAELCRGLRSNSTLRQLHLPYCCIDSRAGAALGEMLAHPRGQLLVLNLQGNRLESEGLRDMCPGLARNPTLTYLSLADNGICGGEADLAGLTLFRDAMLCCKSLTHIDMLYNRIGEAGAEVLLPALSPDNKQIRQFLVDATLPSPLFEALHRQDAGGKKGKKGGGKKGKKKK
jgi:hypothetical protein